MLKFSDEYLMTDLKQRCARYLEQKIVSWDPKAEEMIDPDAINLAVRYKLNAILKSCIMKMAYIPPEDLEKNYCGQVDAAFMLCVYRFVQKKFRYKATYGSHICRRRGCSCHGPGLPKWYNHFCSLCNQMFFEEQHNTLCKENLITKMMCKFCDAEKCSCGEDFEQMVQEL